MQMLQMHWLQMQMLRAGLATALSTLEGTANRCLRTYGLCMLTINVGLCMASWGNKSALEPSRKFFHKMFEQDFPRESSQ